MKNMTSQLKAFHSEEDGVAMTEYIIVFSLLAIGATVSCLSVAIAVKGYRDFLIWWLGHPAV